MKDAIHKVKRQALNYCKIFVTYKINKGLDRQKKTSVRKSTEKRQPSRKTGKEYEEANQRRNHVNGEKHARICNFTQQSGK